MIAILINSWTTLCLLILVGTLYITPAFAQQAEADVLLAHRVLAVEGQIIHEKLGIHVLNMLRYAMEGCYS